MKMIFISFKQSDENQIMQILKNLQIKSYTMWTDVLDKFDTSKLRLGNDIIGPGSNSVILISVDQEKSSSIIKRIKKLNETIKIGKIKAFVLPLEEIVEC